MYGFPWLHVHVFHVVHGSDPEYVRATNYICSKMAGVSTCIVEAGPISPCMWLDGGIVAPVHV